jgi:molybdopterin converting factor small subunit
MASIRIPTPLRPYTGNNEHVQVNGQTVAEALSDLTHQYPELEPHLFNEGKLRSFVNIFLGEDDVRYLNGVETDIKDDSKLLIIPSIAGGSDAGHEVVRKVDHSALRTNQVFIIGLLLIGFIIGVKAWWLVAFVSAVMIIGTVIPSAGLFKRIYQHILKPSGLVKPDAIPDNPEPHLFAQGLGGIFTLGSTIALLAGLPILGWTLTWIVIVLAALNLFLGFCAGCFVYYQLNRLGVPGFRATPLVREALRSKS